MSRTSFARMYSVRSFLRAVSRFRMLMPPQDAESAREGSGCTRARVQTHCTRDSSTGNSSSGTIVCGQESKAECLLMTTTDWPRLVSSLCLFPSRLSPRRATVLGCRSTTSSPRQVLSITAGALNLIDPFSPSHRSPPLRALDARQPRVEHTADRTRDDRADCKELGRSRHLCCRQ